MRPRLTWPLATCALLAGALTVPATATALTAHGQALHPVKPAGATLNAQQSSNWFGYNQGALQAGGGLFHSIVGNWTVPRASRHRKGQAAASSDWIGIGGGCVNSGCGVSDATLIQTGTEQDVSASGKASYNAWWEVIPGPSMPLRMSIRPGDRMHASIVEVLPASNVWSIVIRDVTRRESHTIRVSYSSTQATAEWIEETPLILGTGAGFAALPQLSSPRFDLASVNGHPAQLKASQAIDLINSGGKVIAVPSRPDPDRDGFNACTWTRRCPAPRSS